MSWASWFSSRELSPSLSLLRIELGKCQQNLRQGTTCTSTLFVEFPNSSSLRHLTVARGSLSETDGLGNQLRCGSYLRNTLHNCSGIHVGKATQAERVCERVTERCAAPLPGPLRQPPPEPELLFRFLLPCCTTYVAGRRRRWGKI